MEASRIRRYRAPLALTAAVLLLTGRSATITATSGQSFRSGVSIELPTAYILMSPVSRLLDGLTLLSNPQTVAIFVTVAILLLARVILTRQRARRAQWKRVAFAMTSLIVGIALVELAVAFAARPMARITVADPDAVRVDLHSHTGASHDVRKSYTAERNREWHKSGGFDIAYVSDHVTFRGALAGRPGNPLRAGDGTSLLPAVEGRYHRIMSTIMLGLSEADTVLLNRRGNLLPGVPSSGRGPVTIIALPNRNLDSVKTQSLDSLPRFVAIELIDAAPRGLAQFDKDEAKVRRLASDLRLVLVAASNNHGYGRTVAAWNLFSIPGWRELSPDSVGKLIEQPLRERRIDSVQIVMRTRPRTHGMSLPLTLPVFLYQMIGALTLIERVVWLLWIWIATGVMSLVGQRVRARTA